uniref:CSON001730 protein n=1 Tax=Culicoides sonorensis TaxID=179676 RepID=A0A336MLW1_CULSO
NLTLSFATIRCAAISNSVDEDDILCFGCHEKLKVSTSFFKMCRSSARCIARKENFMNFEENNEIEVEDDFEYNASDSFNNEGCEEDEEIETPDASQDIDSDINKEYIVLKDDTDSESKSINFSKIVVTQPTTKQNFYEIPPNLVCSICNKSFSTIKNYQDHVEFDHNENIRGLQLKKRNIYTDADFDQQTCEYCFEKFDSTPEKTKHEIIHQAEPYPYKCYVCNQQFSNRSVLRDHYESHLNLTWVCSYDGCGKTFKTKHGRWTHEYKHRSEKQPCPICGKYLKTKWAVTQHIKEQHTPRNMEFECPKCHKLFKSQKNLNNHVIIHDEERRNHECPICKKRFLRKSKLTRHHDQVHEAKKMDLKTTCYICDRFDDIAICVNSLDDTTKYTLCLLTETD